MRPLALPTCLDSVQAASKKKSVDITIKDHAGISHSCLRCCTRKNSDAITTEGRACISRCSSVPSSPLLSSHQQQLSNDASTSHCVRHCLSSCEKHKLCHSIHSSHWQRPCSWSVLINPTTTFGLRHTSKLLYLEPQMSQRKANLRFHHRRSRLLLTFTSNMLQRKEKYLHRPAHYCIITELPTPALSSRTWYLTPVHMQINSRTRTPTPHAPTTTEYFPSTEVIR